MLKFLYQLKTSENIRFSRVLGGREMEHWVKMVSAWVECCQSMGLWEVFIEKRLEGEVSNLVHAPEGVF